MDIHERALLVGTITWPVLVFYAYAMWVIKRVTLGREWSWRWFAALPALLLFLAVDVLYNLIIGSFIFWELPRELVYTSRLRRHAGGISSPKRAYAMRMCLMLSKYDPGHCGTDLS